MKHWLAALCLVWISDFTAVVEPGPCPVEEEETQFATLVDEKKSGVSFECKWFRDLCASGAELEQAYKEDETQ